MDVDGGPQPPRLPAALGTLAGWNVTVRLDPDTQTMQFVAAGLEEWQTNHLADCRKLYTEALRWKAGICIRCGGDPAKHPGPNPYMPALWCTSCYDRGAWEEWSWGIPIKKGPVAGHADREAEREADARLFDGIGDDDDGDSGSPALTLWTADGA